MTAIAHEWLVIESVQIFDPCGGIMNQRLRKTVNPFLRVAFAPYVCNHFAIPCFQLPRVVGAVIH